MNKRFIAIILIFCFAFCAFAGCGKKPAPQAEATEPAVTEAPEPTEEPTETPEPIPSLDPYIDKALKTAIEHGLTELDVRGEYESFLRFSETVDGNEGLGEFREFVYRIFPVVADNIDRMDDERFFNMLGGLKIEFAELEGNFGEYWNGTNTVYLNEPWLREEPYKAPELLFHELTHFLDASLCRGSYYSSYVRDGELVTIDDVSSLSSEEIESLTSCRDTAFITEGGAELIASEYLDTSPRTYFESCAFFTGLQYIYGEEILADLLFRTDSDGAFAGMLFDAGYSEERYYAACDTLNHITRPELYPEPQTYIAPEDILIDLYEAERGEGWKEDADFLYILKAMNGIALDGYERSEHAEFLKEIEFTDWEKYEEFSEALIDPLPIECELMEKPPIPVMRGGLMLTATIRWNDPETGEEKHGSIDIIADLASYTLLGYALTDLDELSAQYFDLDTN